MNTTLCVYGQPQPPAQPIELRAGPLCAAFEPDTGYLRCMRAGNVEIVRAVYCAVRDETWGTVWPEISITNAQSGADTCRLAFDARCRRGGIDVRWHGLIEGRADGSLTFTFDAEVLATFRSNRTGLCLLHPAACAGRACRVTHSDGSSEDTAFPLLIAPHQPLMDIRELGCDVGDGLHARIRFAGAVFETEDQRNWSDASFKTYCPPLVQPPLVTFEAGTRIRQTIEVQLEGQPAVVPAQDAIACLDLHALPAAGESLPLLGMRIPSQTASCAERTAQRVRMHAAPRHVRLDVHMDATDWPATLARDLAAAGVFGAPLELALWMRDADTSAVAQCLAQVRAAGSELARCIVISPSAPVPSAEVLAAVRQAVRAACGAVPVGAGTATHFTELNRNRGAADASDFLSYATHPQAHANDLRSIAEALIGQRATVATAASFSGGRPVCVSPVTIKRSAGADQRPLLWSMFGAGFTLGAIKVLAEQGVAAITLHETHGSEGCAADSGAHIGLPAQPCVAPLWHVLADLAELQSVRLVPAAMADPPGIVWLVCAHERGLRLYAANLAFAPVVLCMSGLASSARLRLMDERNVLAAMTQPEDFRAHWDAAAPDPDGVTRITLSPCAYLCCDASH